MAFGYSSENGLDMGPYVTYGGGGYSVVVVGLTTEITGSLNHSLNDLEGQALTTGGSVSGGPVLVGGGFEYNHPVNSTATDSITFNVGAMGLATPPPFILPAEGHVVTTNTHVLTISEAVNGINTVSQNIVDSLYPSN